MIRFEIVCKGLHMVGWFIFVTKFVEQCTSTVFDRLQCNMRAFLASSVGKRNNCLCSLVHRLPLDINWDMNLGYKLCSVSTSIKLSVYPFLKCKSAFKLVFFLNNTARS